MLSSGTLKAVSFIPNGSKIRRRRNSSNVSPEATSTMRPRVSIPARPLYAQPVPGWKSRGAAPSAAAQPATVSVRLRGAMREAASLPAPPLTRPDVWVIRSCTVISRFAGTV